MSTRSLIAIKNEDDSYDYIYCHFDGYPSFTGLYLYEHYKTREEIRKLIAMGNRSSIDNDDSLYDEPFLTLPNLDRLVENFKSSWCEYLYFYDDKWYVHDGEEVTPLSTELMLQGEPIDDEEPIEEEEKFKPTAEALLFTTLQDWGFINIDWNYKIFHGVYEDFMKSLEKHGYVKYVKGDE